MYTRITTVIKNHHCCKSSDHGAPCPNHEIISQKLFIKVEELREEERGNLEEQNYKMH